MKCHLGICYFGGNMLFGDLAAMGTRGAPGAT